MNEKERLVAVLNGNKVDRPPCICPGGMMNMVVTELMDKAGIMWPEAHMDAPKMAGLAVAAYEHDCFENYGVPFCMTIEAEAMGAVVDMGSTVFEPHVVGYAIESVTELERIKKINVNNGRSRVVLDALSILKAREDGVPIIGNLPGPVSLATSLMEPVTYYKEIRKNRVAAHAYMDFVTNELIRFGRAQIESGANVITISDPSGTGEILGPKDFDAYAVKYMNQLIAGLKTGHDDIPVIVHICGQMHKVYPELGKVSADAFSFDAIVNLREAKKQLPGKIIMGNVSSFGLEFATADKVRKMTRKVINDGSDIISPACGLGTQSSLGNIQMMLNTVKGIENYVRD